MDPNQGVSAADWLRRASGDEIARILRTYGEERFAGRIAHAIVQARQQAALATTAELAAIVARANPSWEPGKHPATRSFQAIRIFINNELGELQACLARVVGLLAPGGRLVIISFHSLEDRIVKTFMREQALGQAFPKGVPVTSDQSRPRMKIIGKPVRPSAGDVADNPRARSAVLRIAEKLP